MLKDSGVILLALALTFTLYKVITNDLTHINTTLEKQDTTLQKLNTSIEGNTEVIRSLQFIIQIQKNGR